MFLFFLKLFFLVIIEQLFLFAAAIKPISIAVHHTKRSGIAPVYQVYWGARLFFLQDDFVGGAMHLKR